MKKFRKTIVFVIIGLFIGSGFLSTSGDKIIKLSNNNDQLDQYYEGQGESYTGVFTGDYLAQSFKPTLNILTRLEIFLKNTCTFEDNIEISIRCSIDGDDITSLSLPTQDILSGKNWVEFDLPDIPLIPENEYYIVYTPGEFFDDPSDIITWRNSNHPDYQRGSKWVYNEDGTWEEETNGDRWFKTYGYNNEEPSIPDIDGAIDGKTGEEYSYTFISNDPEEDDISYMIDWGDESTIEWSEYIPSNEEYIISHSWSEENTYTIRGKAKDIYGFETEWATLEVTMPLQIPNNQVQSNIKPGTIFTKWTGENGLHLPTLLGDLIIFIQHNMIVTSQIEDIDEAEFILYDTIGNMVESNIVTSSNEIYSYNFGRPGIGFYKITIKGIKNNDIVSTTNFESILSLST